MKNRKRVAQEHEVVDDCGRDPADQVAEDQAERSPLPLLRIVLAEQRHDDDQHDDRDLRGVENVPGQNRKQDEGVEQRVARGHGRLGRTCRAGGRRCIGRRGRGAGNAACAAHTVMSATTPANNSVVANAPAPSGERTAMIGSETAEIWRRSVASSGAPRRWA